MTSPVLAIDDLSTAGCLTFWRINGGVQRSTFEERWAASGLDAAHLPDMCGPDAALRRAVNEQREKRRLPRPLEKRGAWSIVQETVAGEKLSHRTILSVELNGIGRPGFTAPSASDPLVQTMAEEIEDAYDRVLGEISASDLAVWLAWLVRRVDGVSMREHGGVYFVPPNRMKEWRASAAALGDTVTVHLVPAVRSDDVVAAVLEAVAAEAHAEMEAMRAGLDNGIGKRALATQEQRCRDAAAKVSKYEALLGAAMPELHAAFAQVQIAISAKILSE